MGNWVVLVYTNSSQKFCPLFLPLFLSPWGKFLAKPWQELVGKTLLNIGNQHTSRRSFWIKLFFISLLLLCIVDLKTFNFLRFRNEGSLLTLDQRMMNKSQRAFHKVIIFLVFAFQGFLFRIIMVNYSSNSNCIPSFLNFNFKLLFKIIVKNILL